MNRRAMLIILWAAPALALLASACNPFGNACRDFTLVELQSGVYVSESWSAVGDESSPHAAGEKTLTLDLADDRVTIAYMDDDGREVVETWGVVDIVEGY